MLILMVQRITYTVFQKHVLQLGSSAFCDSGQWRQPSTCLGSNFRFGLMNQNMGVVFCCSWCEMVYISRSVIILISCINAAGMIMLWLWLRHICISVGKPCLVMMITRYLLLLYISWFCYGQVYGGMSC